MNENFSRVLALLRQEKGVSQRKAASELGISQALLSHYENGIREPGLNFVSKACDYYHVSADYLLGRTLSRDGAIIEAEELMDASEAKENLKGSIMAKLQKKLIVNTTSVLFDLLGQVGSKEAVGHAGAYLSSALYQLFRQLYRCAGGNESYFSIDRQTFDMDVLSADMTRWMRSPWRRATRGWPRQWRRCFIIRMRGRGVWRSEAFAARPAARGLQRSPTACGGCAPPGLSNGIIYPSRPEGAKKRGARMNQEKIRNFSIIAHIDHGKSTLADRLLEACGAVAERDMENQLLDNMDLERERGITIKARAVTFDYTAQDGETYTLNLIDTPGHVDFNYEVSRSLAACEGAVLVVDASQGIEAQTLANTYLALDNDLEIRPVVNKIDLPAADPERVKHEIEDIIGIPALDAPEISAKVGLNIPAVLEDVVQHVPAPAGDPDAPLRALIFDSYYDAYKGVIVYFRIVDGTLKKGMPIRMMASGAQYQVLECGLLRPLGYESCEQLRAGQVGYLTASIKNVRDTEVGDTITGQENPAGEALPGYRKAQSMVYCGVYTEDGSKYPDLRDALEKLQLNDASLTFEPESSVALGFGFRCGFLGMLHTEVIQERLEREFDLDLITTLPSVIYKVTKTDGTVVNVDNPHNYPDPSVIAEAQEPFVKVSILTPNEYVGNIMPLCQDRRGEFKDMQYLDTNLVELHYQMPLNEIIYDFFDTLKAHTKGYASLDYELSDYRVSDLVKVDLLLNGDQVDALSFIAHRDKAYPRARRLCEKLKENIPRQLFEVPIQAAIGGRIIARETVKAMRKDVLAKCYGGDITRKKKLLEKQKEGKKKMRNLGTVQLPTEAFMAVLKLDE